jgi:uncharacterized protein (TIGR02466 family)
MKIRNFHAGGAKTVERSFVQKERSEHDSELIMLWPTPVYLGKNNEQPNWHAALNQSIQDKVADREFRGDWFNADFFSLSLDGIEGFKTFLRMHVLRRIEFEIADSSRVRLTWNWNGWVNVLPGSTWHQPHIHEKSTLSFVYYLKVDENIDRAQLTENALKGDIRGGVLQFLDPRGSAPYMSCETIDNVFSSAVRIIPENGLLVLFPSFLSHFVAPITSEAVRISIAGNVFNIKSSPTDAARTDTSPR